MLQDIDKFRGVPPAAAYYGEGAALGSYYSINDGRAAYDDMGNFSIKREKNMLTCYSEQEKNRLKVNPVWIYRKSPVSVSGTSKPSSPSDRLRLEYDGNRLMHVTDSATSGHSYTGAGGFTDLFSPWQCSSELGIAHLAYRKR